MTSMNAEYKEIIIKIINHQLLNISIYRTYIWISNHNSYRLQSHQLRPYVRRNGETTHIISWIREQFSAISHVIDLSPDIWRSSISNLLRFTFLIWPPPNKDFDSRKGWYFTQKPEFIMSPSENISGGEIVIITSKICVVYHK